MKTMFRLVTVVAFFGVSACSVEQAGLIYTDVTLPLDIDMDNTPNPAEMTTSKASSQRVTEPLTGLNVRIEVNGTAFGDAIANQYLDRIYYADIRHQSVLLGIWQKDTVILHGRGITTPSKVVEDPTVDKQKEAKPTASR